MDSNKIKINYDPIERSTSFQFLGDYGQWGDVYEGSDLSRKKYSTAIADGRIGELLQIINDNYNVDENGVKIIFSGTDEVFNEVRSVIKEYEGMTLERCNSKVVVVGKRNSGKTYLVEGIFDFLERKICAADKGGYIEYLDVQDGISIYEIKGIDLGLENVDKAYSFLENRIREGVTTVFYCLFAKSGKIEDIVWLCINHRSHRFEKYELAVVNKMSIKHEIPFSILLTKCISNDESIIEIKLQMWLRKQQMELHLLQH